MLMLSRFYGACSLSAASGGSHHMLPTLSTRAVHAQVRRSSNSYRRTPPTSIAGKGYSNSQMERWQKLSEHTKRPNVLFDDTDNAGPSPIDSTATAAVAHASPLRSATLRGVVDDESISGVNEDSEMPKSSAGPSPPAQNEEHVKPKTPSIALPPLQVRVFDKFGVPVSDSTSLPPNTTTQLTMEYLQPRLHRPVGAFCKRFNITSLNDVQRAVFPLILEGRDVVCVAPPGTGKTFAFLVPSLSTLLATEQSNPRQTHDAEGTPALTSSSLATMIQQRKAKGEICKLCELDVTQSPVCGLTGYPHKQPASTSASSLSAFDDVSPLEGGEGISRSDESPSMPRMIILVPTNQLALQTHHTAQQLAPEGIIVDIKTRARHIGSSQKQKHIADADVLICTPERLVGMLYRKVVQLHRVSIVVMDEADALLSVQMFGQVKLILAFAKRSRTADVPLQLLLFGATLPPPIHDMLRSTMLRSSHRFIVAKPVVTPLPAFAAPSKPSASAPEGAGDRVTYTTFMVSRAEKFDKLFWLFSSGVISAEDRTIVFCNSASVVQMVTAQLKTRFRGRNIKIVSVNAKVSAEANQSSTLRMFQSGVATVLVTTDVLSRGMDFHNVANVVNFDMPLEMETWVHRCGRTARHGLLKGQVLSLFEPANVKIAKPLVAFLRQRGQQVPLHLSEVARSSFVEFFKNSLLHQPTKGFHPRNAELRTPVVGRGQGRIPDYEQHRTNRKLRPQ